jgi:hypothetical protein
VGTGPMTRESRAALLARHEELLAEYVQGVEAESLEYDEERALHLASEAALEEYFASLPRPVLSRCPFCSGLYRHSFDPWGVDGYWWQEEAAKTTAEPEACPHFGVLQGAVDLGGKPVRGGREEARVGPGVPFVIPRVLEQPGVVAVVHALPMAGGLTAWPIVYFAREPLPPGSFTQRWTRSSYNYPNGKGGFGWRVDTDPWDFELGPWVERRKLLWIERGDPEHRLRSGTDGPCPYVGLEGVRGLQVVQGEEVLVLPPPAGEGVDPFST